MAGILLGIAISLSLLCSLGLVLMPDTFQRIHFSAPIVGLSLPLITLALWLENHDTQARIKSVLITVLLFAVNAVITHALARAQRIRCTGHWEYQADDGSVEIVSRKGPGS